MFGYIKPFQPELKFREYHLFRAYYCGLCLALARLGGHLCRATVSYDSTFLAIVLASLAPDPEQLSPYRCPLHPLKPRPVVITCPELEYAAGVNLLLAHHSALDAWQDGERIKGLAGRFLISRGIASVRRHPRLSQIEAAITGPLAELARLELEQCSSLDRAADPFARLLAAITLAGLPDPRPAPSAERVGYLLGKWIYTIDALADLERDAWRGSYNPLLAAHPQLRQEPGRVREKMREEMRFVLMQTLADLARATEDLPLVRNRGLISNILYEGLHQVTQRYASTGGHACESVRSSGCPRRSQRREDPPGL
ncbi:MAG: DUF5685 family protein [Bacillota bacterium]